MEERIQMPYGTAVKHENGIYELIFEGEMTDPEKMKRNNEVIEDQFKFSEQEGTILMLVDLAKVTKSNKAVRKVSSTDENADTAVALLVGGGLSRIVGNLFISFGRPKYPTKIFTNREKAIQWLLTHK